MRLPVLAVDVLANNGLSILYQYAGRYAIDMLLKCGELDMCHYNMIRLAICYRDAINITSSCLNLLSTHYCYAIDMLYRHAIEMRQINHAPTRVLSICYSCAMNKLSINAVMSNNYQLAIRALSYQRAANVMLTCYRYQCVLPCHKYSSILNWYLVIRTTSIRDQYTIPML